MHYVIDKVITDPATGDLKFWVQMWESEAEKLAGTDPYTEDCTLAVRTSRKEHVLDGSGNMTRISDGTTLARRDYLNSEPGDHDPNDFETRDVAVDMRAEVIAMISRVYGTLKTRASGQPRDGSVAQHAGRTAPAAVRTLEGTAGDA